MLDGTGYVEDGREIFDDGEDDDCVASKPSSKSECVLIISCITRYLLVVVCFFI